jgi:hypothetical protein
MDLWNLEHEENKCEEKLNPKELQAIKNGMYKIVLK